MRHKISILPPSPAPTERTLATSNNSSSVSSSSSSVAEPSPHRLVLWLQLRQALRHLCPAIDLLQALALSGDAVHGRARHPTKHAGGGCGHQLACRRVDGLVACWGWQHLVALQVGQAERRRTTREDSVTMQKSADNSLLRHMISHTQQQHGTPEQQLLYTTSCRHMRNCCTRTLPWRPYHWPKTPDCCMLQVLLLPHCRGF
jgi:hypothetical protein